MFFSMKGSYGNDIQKSSSNDIESYSKECDELPDCKGFDSDGYLKFQILNYSRWSSWTNEPNKGLYLKSNNDPTNDYHYSYAIIVCGHPSGICPSKTGDIVPTDSKHPVRCCSDSFKEGWQQNDGCDVWAQSKFDSDLGSSTQCYASETLASANGICASVGARLCTQSELDNRCAGLSGCYFDHAMVWSYDNVIPVSQISSHVIVEGGRPSHAHVVCGDMVNGRCPKKSKLLSTSVQKRAATRCCSDTPRTESDWHKNPGCDNWVGSRTNLMVKSKFVCLSKATWTGANKKCVNDGSRLCTMSEMESGCADNTGCRFEDLYVWTSDSNWV
jgi:hypothetical protein